MKKYIFGLIVFASLTVLCLYVFLSREQSAPVAKMTEVTIAEWGQEKILLYLPLYVAMEEGFFENNGIKVNLVFTGNDDQTFAAVVGGDADFGFADPVFSALAVEKGLKAKTIAELVNSLGVSGYTNLDTVPIIKSAIDLAHMRVGSFPEPSTTYTLLTDLKNSNSGLEGLQIVQGSIGSQLAMLEAGQVDIAVDLEPAVSEAENKGYRVVFSLADFTPRQAITGLTVMQRTIDAHPEVVQKVVSSLQQAVTAMYSDTDHKLIYDTATKVFPHLSSEVLHRAVDRMMKAEVYPRSVAVQDAEWQRSLELRLKNGQLKYEQETAAAVDNSFADAAQKP